MGTFFDGLKVLGIVFPKPLPFSLKEIESGLLSLHVMPPMVLRLPEGKFHVGKVQRTYKLDGFVYFVALLIDSLLAQIAVRFEP